MKFITMIVWSRAPTIFDFILLLLYYGSYVYIHLSNYIYFKLPIWFIGRLKRIVLSILNHIKLITKYNRVAECQQFFEFIFYIIPLFASIFLYSAFSLIPCKWYVLSETFAQGNLWFTFRLSHTKSKTWLFKWVGVLTTHIWKYLPIVYVPKQNVLNLYKFFQRDLGVLSEFTVGKKCLARKLFRFIYNVVLDLTLLQILNCLFLWCNIVLNKSAQWPESL